MTTFGYDGKNRINKVRTSDGYEVATEFDNLDRKSVVTYPDSTTEEFIYTNAAGAMTLDLTGSKDTRGLWTYRHYDANRHMDSITDPLNRTIQYGWCSCGALESITDAKNQTTWFDRDVQGRVFRKRFADNSKIEYLYEGQTVLEGPGASSRLASSTDAKNQRTNYAYFPDDSIQQVSYAVLNGQPATPAVTYTYNPNYRRVATMTDGVGLITYGYGAVGSLGALLLTSIDGPWNNDTVTITYDELGRWLSEAVNGTAESWTYDALGRIGTTTSPLGLFSNTYDGVTPRLQSTALPNGQTASYVYWPNSGDNRLKTIQHNAPGGSLLSKFDYEYDYDGQITKLTRQLGASGFPMEWAAAGGGSMYDAADQLTNVTERSATNTYTTASYSYDAAGNPSTGGSTTYDNVNRITNPGYAYDSNGNLTADTWRTYEWDAANRLIAINYPPIGARTEFTYNGVGQRVKIIEKAPTSAWSMLVQPVDAQYGNFSNTVTLAAGNYTLALEGLNPNGGENTALIDIVKVNGTLVGSGSLEVPALPAGTYAYRPTGGSWLFAGQSGASTRYSTIAINNPLPPQGTQMGFLQNNGKFGQTLSLASGSYTVSLAAAQRATGNSSAQQVRVSLNDQTLTTTSSKRFIWIGSRIAEERDSSNAVTRRYYPEGEQRVGGTRPGLYFYSRDHLGSIREMTGTAGNVRARYDYDAYGNTKKLAGDLDVDFGYTGLYRPVTSGLYLALYRAYDPSVARWLSRDPIGEVGGINLYGYVLNDPVNLIDPLGLFDLNFLFGKEKGWGDNAPSIPGELTVGAHGTPVSLFDSNGNNLPIEKLADYIRNHPDYDPTRPVRLMVCNAGTTIHPQIPTVGERLADALGSPVIAADTPVKIVPSGRTGLPAWGHWIRYTPNR